MSKKLKLQVLIYNHKKNDINEKSKLAPMYVVQAWHEYLGSFCCLMSLKLTTEVHLLFSN